LNTDHSALIELMRAVRKIEGINKVYIASGIRTDLAWCDERYIQELVEHHTGGHLSAAPEHTHPAVLELMNKPPIENYDQFCSLFATISKKLGKEQYVVPYLMAGFPGTTLAMTIEAAVYLKRNGIRSEQVQEFVPGPFELATCMYYTGLNPITGQPVYVPMRFRERRQQKALLMWHDPNNYHDIKSALKEAQREDLVGTGADCLIAPYPPKSLSMRRSSRVKRLQTQNEKSKKQKTERREMLLEAERQKDVERREKKRAEKLEKLRQEGKLPKKPFNRSGGPRSGGRKPFGKPGERTGGGFQRENNTNPERKRGERTFKNSAPKGEGHRSPGKPPGKPSGKPLGKPGAKKPGPPRKQGPKRESRSGR
jgi:hypothetical protein